MYYRRHLQEKIAEVVKTKTYTVNINGYPKTINNTNELLGYLDGVNGVKTGFTNGAGRCLVTSVERNGFNIITVVLGADTKKIRTKDSIRLIEYIYSNYEIVDLEKIINEEYNKWLKLNKNKFIINKGKKNVLKNQFETYLYVLEQIITEGIEAGEFYDIDAKHAASNLMYVIEGLKVSSRTVGLSESVVDDEIMYVMQGIIAEE